MSYSVFVFASFAAVSLSAATITMKGNASDGGNSADTIYSNGEHNGSYWSDKAAPGPGNDYVVPAGYTIGINAAQGSVDFGGDSLIVSGLLRWYGHWDSKYKCTKPIIMKGGSEWNIYNGQYTYNYANYTIDSTDSSPVTFSQSVGGESGRVNYFNGTVSGTETSYAKWICTASSGYVMDVVFDSGAFTNYSGRARFDGVRSVMRTTKANWPCALEAVNGATLKFTGNAVTSTVSRLKIDGKSKLTFSTAGNGHAIAVTNCLAVADGAVLALNKFSSIPYATASDDGVRRYPVFILSKEAYENPETSVGSVVCTDSKAIEEIPHGFIYTNVLDNGGAEIGWTHIPIVKQTAHGGWGNSVFKDDSAKISSMLSDGRPMHGGDYVLGGDFYDYPQTTLGTSQYVSPANCVLFNGSTHFWYSPDIYISNCVLRSAGAFVSFTSGHRGYTLRGKTRIVPNSSGAGWNFTVRHSHVDSLQCDLSGSGLLIFGFGTTFKDDAINRWYGVYKFGGDNSAFTGRMRFRMCNDGNYEAFSSKGAEAFVQGASSNIVVWAGDSNSFGGALSEFDASAVEFGNWTRLLTTTSIEFADQTRGWTLMTNVLLSVKSDSTLTLANPIVCRGGGIIEVNGSTSMPYVGDNFGGIELGGALVLGGAITVAAGEEAPTLKMVRGALRFAAKNALTGVNLALGENATLSVDPNATDAGLKTYGAVLTGDVSFPANSTVALTLASSVVEGTTVGVMTVADSLASTALAKLAPPRVRGFGSSLSAESNGDGTTTIRLGLARRGTAVFVR